jgi:hypothetical protein
VPVYLEAVGAPGGLWEPAVGAGLGVVLERAWSTGLGGWRPVFEPV